MFIASNKKLGVREVIHGDQAFFLAYSQSNLSDQFF